MMLCVLTCILLGKNVKIVVFAVPAKQAMNMMMQEVDTILSLCANGEDPDQCHPDLTNCTGNCSSCGGCH